MVSRSQYRGTRENNWLSVGFRSGDINTSDGLTKSLPSANLWDLLGDYVSRITTEGRMNEIRKKIPSPEHYIVYPETIHGGVDLDTDMRRKTRAGRSSRRNMVSGWKPPLIQI